MGILFYACVAVDETDPEGNSFSVTPSVWSFFNDYMLVQCGERTAYAAMGLDFSKTRYDIPNDVVLEPLYALRGTPQFFGNLSNDLQLIADGDHSSWLTVNEFFDALAHGGVEVESCSSRFRLFVDVLRLLKSQLGGDRVVVIFDFAI